MITAIIAVGVGLTTVAFVEILNRRTHAYWRDPKYYVVDFSDNFVVFSGTLRECESVVDTSYGGLCVINGDTLRGLGIPENKDSQLPN